MAATVVAPGRPLAAPGPRSRRLSFSTPSARAISSRASAPQAHPHPAAHDRDGRGHGALGADGVLDLARHAQVVGPRQPVGDDRRLQGHHGPACRERRGDLVGDLDHQMRAGCQTVRISQRATENGMAMGFSPPAGFLREHYGNTSARWAPHPEADPLRKDPGQ